ncbi:unnamed protein product [Parnassius apollo]|uniref:(apollo) hypothetical protein n=1 Tax=Parnassius apollo TaxID=110799 RepID=A0A8S3XWH1_PARAO|nr:unnamed protein product [Parnassius apollo]
MEHYFGTYYIFLLRHRTAFSMSDGDVSLIRDEDVLRRMWQQTQDFSRKKEIRAHMYRLREERLRNLYSPEPTADSKGCEFTSSQGHVKSFADQSFQSMKSKEVRDAGSPPKEFMYRGQDLKELSNAGWNVESENRTTDDGHTHIKTVQANIEGKYDVEGGKGQFVAIDHNKQAVTEYDDGNTSLKKNESSSNTAAHEQVVRRLDDGSHFSSSTSSSTATSKYQEISSTTHDATPFLTEELDLTRQYYDNKPNEEMVIRRITKTNDYEQNLRNNYEQGELLSRKVEYPDDNTKVIVETRCLPDGTRVTSTRREFRAPVVQSCRSEHHSQKSKSESKSTSHSTSTQHSDFKESSSKIILDSFDNRSDGIVDHQRTLDDYDFKRNYTNDYSVNQIDDYGQTTQQQNNKQKYETKIDEVDRHNVISSEDKENNQRVIYHDVKDQTQYREENKEIIHDIRNEKQIIDEVDHHKVISSENKKVNERVIYQDVKDQTQYRKENEDTVHDVRNEKQIIDEVDRYKVISSKDKTDNQRVIYHDVKDQTKYRKENKEVFHDVRNEKQIEENIERKISTDRYETTYQSDYNQKKISTDWSPSHQAWASSLRSDTPTRQTTRASSPGSRTFVSSNSSLRSSVSPDKTHRKPSSRGGSPTKTDRSSPIRNTSERYSSTHSMHSVDEVKEFRRSEDKPPHSKSPARSSYSPEKKVPNNYRQKPSVSPEKTSSYSTPRYRDSPDRKPENKVGYADNYPRTTSPSRQTQRNYSPTTPERKPSHHSDDKQRHTSNYPRNISPERSNISGSSPRQSLSPNRKPAYERPHNSPDRKSGFKTHLSDELLKDTISTSTRSSPSPERKPKYHASDLKPNQDKNSPSALNPVQKPNAERNSVSPETKPTYDSITKQNTSKTIRRSPSPGSCYQRPTTPNNTPSNDRRSKSPERKLEHTNSNNDFYPDSEVPSNFPIEKPRDDKSAYPDKISKETHKSIKKAPENDYSTKTQNNNYEKQLHNRDSGSPERNPHVEMNRKSPVKQSPTTYSATKPYTKGTTTVKEDHYKFIDEETKMYTPTDKTDSTNENHPFTNVPVQKSPVSKGVTKEPSPNKSSIKFTDDKLYETKIDHTTTDVLREHNETIYANKREHHTPKRIEISPLPNKNVTSPAKFSTPDKKPHHEEPKSPTKQHQPVLSNKSSPRNSVSPSKTSIQDNKHTLTTDFIDIEKSSEEANKKITDTRQETVKSRSRQLVTPSSSPTRKLKPENEPSTGQSSPTTSVSGFVYFSSPRREILVTDLDDSTINSELTGTITDINAVEVTRPSSPSKIPCRSPSPQKVSSPSKSSLPRKSSLKKTSSEKNQVPSTEQPPSSFRVSPKSDFPESEVTQNHPIKSENTVVKPKPPLERRETYEERCLKILGMMKEDSLKSVEATVHSKKPDSNLTSPSISPCESPEPNHSSFKEPVNNKTTEENKNLTDFLTKESEHIIKTSSLIEIEQTPRHKPAAENDIKLREREKSPTKTKTQHETISFIKEKDRITDDVSGTVKTLVTSKKVTSSHNDGTPLAKIKPDKQISRDTSPTKSHNSDNTQKAPAIDISPGKKFVTNKQPNLSKDSSPLQTLAPEKTPSRDTSPTKLRDIISHSEFNNIKSSTISSNNDVEKETNKKIVSSKYPSSHSVDLKPKNSDEDSKPEYSSSPTSKIPGKKVDVEHHEYDKAKKPSSDSLSKQAYKIFERQDVSEDNELESKQTGLQLPKAHDKTNRYPKEVIPNKYGRPRSPDKKIVQSNNTEEDEKRRIDKLPHSLSTVCKTSEDQSKLVSVVKEQEKQTKLLTQNVDETEDYTTQLILSEREQEVMDRVQKSLRKLSPERKERAPSREKSPMKTSTCLRDIDVKTHYQETREVLEADESTETIQKRVITARDDDTRRKPKSDKSKDIKVSSKPSSRNVSPTKKVTNMYSPRSETPDSAGKPRSTSPKKHLTSMERPKSPQIQKTTSVKPKEHVPSQLTRKPSPIKVDKTTTNEIKKTSVTKQNSFTKTATTKSSATKTNQSIVNKNIDLEARRTTTSKILNKDITSKKDTGVKVTRTSSDITLKSKKPTFPQKVKSKPEIQVNDISTSKINKQINITKTDKTVSKESQSKLPSKPKSATALNTSDDDDDVIIDVQQAKSSRENSPDRICPTPINFSDDVGIPRFPDEVNEPDDDFHKRTHHTIHETESIVDDIVEICEEDELFVKKTEEERVTDAERSILTVDNKVSKFTKKLETINKPKDTTTRFKHTERKVHSDFMDDKLTSDECLLSVSEKVNKFAKGPSNTKESRSPSRNIKDEYDKDTVYQDNYTKLSVNDKAHLFIETAENIKVSKPKIAQKIERPDLNDVDESLKSDDCLLSVSDKVNKFVKTAEQFLSESCEVEEKEKKIKEQHDQIMRKIIENVDYDSDYESKNLKIHEEFIRNKELESSDEIVQLSQDKPKDISSPNKRPTEKTPVKITTLRSSEAVKKAKALFENIASNNQTTKDIKSHTRVTKLTDSKKTPKADSRDSKPYLENDSLKVTKVDSEKEISKITSSEDSIKSPINIPKPTREHDDKPRQSPSRLRSHSPDISRNKSPVWKLANTTTTVNTSEEVSSKYPTSERSESPLHRHEHDIREKSQDKIPGYLRPTKTSQLKDETKVIETTDVSSRRGSGKFGVELRRTSIERSTISSERRRSSVDHNQPSIEDIFNINLLEQMLDKVVGYEQRRRIRAQIRIAKKSQENKDVTNSNAIKETVVTITKAPSTERRQRSHTPEYQTRSTPQKSPERESKSYQKIDSPVRQSSPQRVISSECEIKPHIDKTLSPERKSPDQKTVSPDITKPNDQTTLFNGHTQEPSKILVEKRPQSPSKLPQKSTATSKSPLRPTSPDKKARPASPTKSTRPSTPSKLARPISPPKQARPASPNKQTRPASPTKSARPASPTKSGRLASPTKSATTKSTSHQLSEYASVYMKKIGLKTEGVKTSPSKLKKSPENLVKQEETVTRIEDEAVEIDQTSDSINKNVTERTSSEDVIEIMQTNGKRSPSPQEKRSSKRRSQSPEKSPSPESRRPIQQETKVEKTKETITKTVNDIGKKVPTKQLQEEKPSWVTNRNLKKVASTARTYSSKKIESEKPKYRAPSPSKVISKPIDVITSSYGPGPLDADGRPLFGIKALRNGATNYQVKGTVIRQEYHSKNGGEPVGTVSVTAYSTEPEDLEKLLQDQGERPSKIHGLAAITTTKKFGGDTGTTYSEIHTKEDRAALDQFTHSDRRVSESKIDRSSEIRYVEDTREKKHSVTEKGNTYSVECRHERHDKENDSEYSVKITRQEEESDSTQKYDQQEISETYIMESRREDSRRQKETVDSGYRVEIKRQERIGDDRETRHHEKGVGNVRKDRVERIQTVERVPRSKETGKSERIVETKTSAVRRGSVKSLTEKFIKNASETSKSERSAYPKAGLILRSSGLKDSVSSDSSAHAGLTRTDSEQSLGSGDDNVITTTTTTTTTTRRQDMGDGDTSTTHTRTSNERSFLDSNTKVTGVQDILTRMKNADIVVEESDSCEDAEARALLNKFLGASVLMAGMQGYVTEQPTGKVIVKQETIHSSGGKVTSSTKVEEFDLERCWDERVLRKLLEECSDYEQRRRLRARIRTLMAEQEACTSAVTEALAAAGEDGESRGESLLLPLLHGLLGAARGRERDGEQGKERGGERSGLAGAGAAVLADVRRALARLRAALAPPANHPQAQALLSLADRLEDALDAADRLDGCPRTRRRRRASRHTVAVTHQDLEEARRLISDSPQQPEPSCEEKVTPTHTSVEAPQMSREVRVVRRTPAPRRPDFFRHSVADTLQPDPVPRWPESKSGIAAIANKFNSNVESPPPPVRRAPVSRPPPASQRSMEEPPRAPLYRPPPPTYNFAVPPSADDVSKPLNRFSNSKRARMKRANTIDIGKPLGGYHIDVENEDAHHAPAVPEFRPKTENDRKFLAFMQKNQENERASTAGPANWSSRFGNIKNAFENREREQQSTRSVSASSSSAKRFWQASDEHTPRPRKFLSDITTDINRPPWVSQRREPNRAPAAPPVLPPSHSSPLQAPIQYTAEKPFIAKPIPVNQFSHAPMSPFKPPKKIASPISAPPNVWSPPSSNIIRSPTAENLPECAFMPKSFVPSPPVPRVPWATDNEKPRKSFGQVASKFENEKFTSQTAPPPKLYSYQPSTPPTRTISPQIRGYPIKAIPSQNDLAAPELVKKIHETNPHRSPEPFPEPVDAQKLQIEFYERQIREKSRRGSTTNVDRKPPAAPAPLPTYTVVDYTPPNAAASFVPLQQTPDIEKAKAHKVDYLPDVVMNERGGEGPMTNGDAEDATEHDSVETKVMRGPVRGSATITTGVRTRNGAADSLSSALHRLASPKHDIFPQMDRQAQKAQRAAISPGGSSEGSPNARSPASPASSRKLAVRTKSMHLLAAPKLYEGGIAREQLPEKKRTVEAYFSGRVGAGRPGAGGYALGRSRTVATLSELQLLDESNADDAFEDLVSALA